MVTNRLDPSKWQKGTAGKPASTFFNVLGFTQPDAYPQLDTSLTKQVAAAVDSGGKSTSATSGSGSVPALPKSGRYSLSQLEDLWIAAGGNARYKLIAAAIALAESGGNPKAVNINTNGSTDRGLWQINSVHGSQSTFDVLKNAQAAVAISRNGSDWSPWVTFVRGAYVKFLPSPIPSGQWVPTGLSSGSSRPA
jgi:hypothetical protein